MKALEQREDAQIANVIAILHHIRPDILLINEFDWDREGRAAAAFQSALAEGPKGLDYPHLFTSRPNSGMPSGLDLDGDGMRGRPGDAFGYGVFPGQYGMLLLSRFPIDQSGARSFAELLWADLPGASLPTRRDGSPFPSQEAWAAMRLSSKSHWDVAVMTPGGPLHVLASHPTPPVFDGPEDLNGLRNAGEIRFWSLYLEGAAFRDDQGRIAPWAGAPSVVMGDLNADPVDGDGVHAAIAELLGLKALADPKPASAGGAHAGTRGAANLRHKGDPRLDTADWNDTRGPGNLRVDYILPTRDLEVVDAGVFWPAPDDPLAALLGTGKARSSDHRLVWLDIRR